VIDAADAAAARSEAEPGAAGIDGPVQTVLRALAAWGLPGERRLPSEAARAAGSDLIGSAAEARLIGVLAVANQAGELPLDDDIAERVALRHRDALLWCLRLEVELLATLDRLARIGVRPLVLKGPALAHVDAPDPALRTFADLDLLVPAEQIDAAVVALVAAGADRPVAERRAGFDRRFAKSVTLRTASGVELDLHRTLVDGAHGLRVPLRRLQDHAATFELAGTSVACLGSVHRLLHSAYHLALGSPTPRLGNLRDLASALTAPGVEWPEVVAEAERWGGAAVLALAVQLTVDELEIDAPEPAAWAARLEVSDRERAIIDRHRAEGSGIGRAKLDALREPQPWSQRLAYLHALVAPTRAHLASRGLRYRDLVRRR
jgi:hypothetical protein